MKEIPIFVVDLLIFIIGFTKHVNVKLWKSVIAFGDSNKFHVYK